MIQVFFQPKLVGETFLAKFDFASRLDVGVTISTAVVTCTVYSGTDASPSSMISGADSTSGTIITQAITGGTLGVVYYLLCTITTSDSQTLLAAGFLAVVPNVV